MVPPLEQSVLVSYATWWQQDASQYFLLAVVYNATTNPCDRHMHNILPSEFAYAAWAINLSMIG